MDRKEIRCPLCHQKLNLDIKYVKSLVSNRNKSVTHSKLAKNLTIDRVRLHNQFPDLWCDNPRNLKQNDSFDFKSQFNWDKSHQDITLNITLGYRRSQLYKCEWFRKP